MPAAGSGSRLGGDVPKALLPLGGSPLFIQALTPFIAHQNCVEAIISAPPDFVERFQTACKSLLRDAAIRVIPGGLTRQDSVHLALRASAASSDVVLIHDAARPFVSGIIIQRVLDSLRNGAVAALPGLKIVDTLKLAVGNPPKIQNTVSRDGLFAVQTPQAILKVIALDAFERAAQDNFQATDDVGLIEKYSLGDVAICEGDPRNFKVTTQSDLARARAMLERA